ncbi:MAG: hypothetical protein JOZ96_26215 [Acidobacteria bacterium]|nr:hypothetical protein [Acidobacteriota bacterium]
MDNSERLLELIELGVVEHGGDLGGRTRLSGGTLQLFDGRVTLRAELADPGPAAAGKAVHAHVLTTLHEYGDELLDACVFGMGGDPEAALGEAALIWITGVAGPIKSLLDDKPVCNTCRAGVAGGDASKGYVQGDYGLPGLRAYVGPAFSRGFGGELDGSALDDTKPWFRFAAESAAPRRVHLAKASVLSKGEAGWSRDLEVDGHEVSHHDPDWPAGVRGTAQGYLTRFAVFEFPRDSAELRRRVELERTIIYFADNFSRHDSVDKLMEAMVGRGFDPDLVHETEAFATMAFGRVLFERHGVQYAPTFIHARRDGRVETDVPLMSIPAYARARVLAVQLGETMERDQFQSLCVYHAESGAILQAIEKAGDKLDLSQIKMYPCVVPERGASEQTMEAALALLKGRLAPTRPPEKKPRWKFW